MVNKINTQAAGTLGYGTSCAAVELGFGNSILLQLQLFSTFTAIGLNDCTHFDIFVLTLEMSVLN